VTMLLSTALLIPALFSLGVAGGVIPLTLKSDPIVLRQVLAIVGLAALGGAAVPLVIASITRRRPLLITRHGIYPPTLTTVFRLRTPREFIAWTNVADITTSDSKGWLEVTLLLKSGRTRSFPSLVRDRLDLVLRDVFPSPEKVPGSSIV